MTKDQIFSLKKIATTQFPFVLWLTFFIRNPIHWIQERIDIYQDILDMGRLHE